MTQGNLYGEAKRDSIAYVYKKKIEGQFYVFNIRIPGVQN